jgi:hypothetical protein
VPLAIHRHVPAAPGVGQEGVAGEQEGSLRVRLQGVARGGGEGGRGMYHLWQKRIRCLLPGAKCIRGGPQQAGRGAGGGAVQCSAAHAGGSLPCHLRAAPSTTRQRPCRGSSRSPAGGAAAHARGHSRRPRRRPRR